MHTPIYLIGLAVSAKNGTMDRYRWAEPRTFAATVLVACVAIICTATAKAQLGDLFRTTGGFFANHLEYHRITSPPGKEFVTADLAGPGKITYFCYTDDSHFHPTEGTGFMYPGLVLEIFWDDAAEPSVRLPLWSYFSAFERQTFDYQSLPMQINHYCYMSYLPMPFSKRAVLYWRTTATRSTRAASLMVSTTRTTRLMPPKLAGSTLPGTGPIQLETACTSCSRLAARGKISATSSR